MMIRPENESQPRIRRLGVDAVPTHDWLVESLRFTVFWTHPQIPDENRSEHRGSWKELLGSQPDQSNWNSQTHSFSEEGPHLDARLRVDLQPSRTDWRLLPDPSKNLSSNQLLTVGSYMTTSPAFGKLMKRWLSDCPPINRLAFGAVLLLPADDFVDSIRKLNHMLPLVQLHDEDAREFLYRINRPRKSRMEIPNLKINRLGTWSSVQTISGVIELTLGGPAKSQGNFIPVQSSLFACRLELDINTNPDFGLEIPEDIRGEVFEELAGHCSEIAANGDIP